MTKKMGKQNHIWQEKEQVVAIYMALHSPHDYKVGMLNIDQCAHYIGVRSSVMRVMVDNFKAFAGKANLGTDCDKMRNAFEKYKKEIKDVYNACERQLVEKEVYVFNFYLKKGKYEAAANRLKYLNEKFSAKNAEIDARLAYLECVLAHEQKNKVLYSQTLGKLTKLYPDSGYAKMAQRLTEKTIFVF